jgi:hypothetical protein
MMECDAVIELTYRTVYIHENLVVVDSPIVDPGRINSHVVDPIRKRLDLRKAVAPHRSRIHWVERPASAQDDTITQKSGMISFLASAAG